MLQVLLCKPNVLCVLDILRTNHNQSLRNLEVHTVEMCYGSADPLLHAIALCEPDLLILHWTSRGLRELLKEIRKGYPALPIVGWENQGKNIKDSRQIADFYRCLHFVTPGEYPDFDGKCFFDIVKEARLLVMQEGNKHFV